MWLTTGLSGRVLSAVWGACRETGHDRGQDLQSRDGKEGCVAIKRKTMQLCLNQAVHQVTGPGIQEGDMFTLNLTRTEVCFMDFAYCHHLNFR